VSRVLSGSSFTNSVTGDSKQPPFFPKLVIQVLQALDYLDGQRIVHRDVKPENVLVDEAGDFYLADFGFAKVENRDNTPVGTVAYMAPENFDRNQLQTRKADIWSAGVMILEALDIIPRFPLGPEIAKRRMMYGDDRWFKMLRKCVEERIPQILPMFEMDQTKRYSAQDCLRRISSNEWKLSAMPRPAASLRSEPIAIPIGKVPVRDSNVAIGRAGSVPLTQSAGLMFDSDDAPLSGIAILTAPEPSPLATALAFEEAGQAEQQPGQTAMPKPREAGDVAGSMQRSTTRQRGIDSQGGEAEAAADMQRSRSEQAKAGAATPQQGQAAKSSFWSRVRKSFSHYKKLAPAQREPSVLFEQLLTMEDVHRRQFAQEHSASTPLSQAEAAQSDFWATVQRRFEDAKQLNSLWRGASPLYAELLRLEDAHRRQCKEQQARTQRQRNQLGRESPVRHSQRSGNSRDTTSKSSSSKNTNPIFGVQVRQGQRRYSLEPHPQSLRSGQGESRSRSSTAEQLHDATRQTRHQREPNDGRQRPKPRAEPSARGTQPSRQGESRSQSSSQPSPPEIDVRVLQRGPSYRAETRQQATIESSARQNLRSRQVEGLSTSPSSFGRIEAQVRMLIEEHGRPSDPPQLSQRELRPRQSRPVERKGGRTPDSADLGQWLVAQLEERQGDGVLPDLNGTSQRRRKKEQRQSATPAGQDPESQPQSRARSAARQRRRSGQAQVSRGGDQAQQQQLQRPAQKRTEREESSRLRPPPKGCCIIS
jgi:serine/threonine protein kinase